MKSLPKDFNFGIGQKVFAKKDRSLQYTVRSISPSAQCNFIALSPEANLYLEEHKSTINAPLFYTLLESQSNKRYPRPGDIFSVSASRGTFKIQIPYETESKKEMNFPIVDSNIEETSFVSATIEQVLEMGTLVDGSNPKETLTPQQMLANLHEMKVFGQKEASESVIPQLKNYLVDIHNPERPIFSSIFVGPTGVGKTELAKEIAKATKFKFVRFDMSEYCDKHNAARFLGSPQGYLGSKEPSILETEMSNSEEKVVLFDEIEKAHPEILRLFLQVVDDGILTLSNGTKINFKNCIVLFTSNLGVVYKDDGRHIVDMSEIKNSLPPELLGRIDKVATFQALDQKSYEMILSKIIDNFNEKRLWKKNMKVTLTKNALDHLIKIGVSNRYGARSLKAAVEQNLTSFIADKMLSGEFTSGNQTVDYNDGEFSLLKLRLVA